MIKIKEIKPTGELPTTIINFEKEVDALYIKMRSGTVEKSIESYDPVIIDMTKQNEIYGIESLERFSDWKITPSLISPKKFKEASIIFGKEDYKEQDIECQINKDKTLLHIRLEPLKPSKYFKIADKVIIGVSKENLLVDFWVIDIPKNTFI